MANPNTWYDVEWTNGDTLTEEKLDRMMGDSDFMRYEAGFKTICTFGQSKTNPSAADDVAVFIDSTEITGFSGSGDGPYKKQDYDITGLSEGIHTLTVELDGVVYAECRFFVTVDMNYVTIWYEKSYDASDSELYLKWLTAITSRETMSW